MKLTTDESLGLAMTEEVHRINQGFIDRSIKAWDAVGRGCFKVFIECYVAMCWLEMTSKN